METVLFCEGAQHHQLSVIVDDASMYWFNAKELCKLLGVQNSRQATSDHNVDEKRLMDTETTQGKQQCTMLSITGVIKLIVRSKKPIAKLMTDWILKFVHNSIAKRLRDLSNAFPTSTQEDTVLKEKDVRDNMAQDLNGVTEFETRSGFADVVTSEEVIEVKYVKQWKHALGQVLAYSDSLPDKQRRIHLFSEKYDDNDDDLATLVIAKDICSKYSVKVTCEWFLKRNKFPLVQQQQ